MENFGIIKSAILLLTIAATVLGRPTSDVGVETEEIKQYRLEASSERDSRPCYARRVEVKADLLQYEEIQGDPRYVPECDNNGTTWRLSQCDHHDAGACFCVHKENGEIRERTRDLNVNKEALECGGRSKNTFSGNVCFHMRDEFNRMQKEYGLTGESPLLYYPDCTMNGTFRALQRNDMSNFFCVDTKIGTIIPDTETEADAMPPLTEDLCEAYDEVWQDFKQWNSTHDGQTQDLEIDDSYCGDGFTFTSCGCPVMCTHRTTYASLTVDCQCKPACICPKDMLELDGKCITLEECHEAKPPSKADKLDALTNGDYSRWKEYKKLNPNAVLETYNSLGMPKENLYASGPIAYDVNPNSRMLYMEPPQEEPVEENNFGFFGGEPIPIQGENVPVLLQVLEENGPEIDEVEEYQESQNLYGTEEPLESIGGEPIPVEGEDLPILLQVIREGGPSPQEVEEYHEAQNLHGTEEPRENVGGEPIPVEGEDVPILLQVIREGGPSPQEVEEYYEEEFTELEEEEERYQQGPTEEEEEHETTSHEEEEYFPQESDNSSPEERTQSPEEESFTEKVENKVILPKEATSTEYITPQEEEEFNEESFTEEAEEESFTEEVEDELILPEEAVSTVYTSPEEEFTEESFTEEMEDELILPEEAVSTVYTTPEEEEKFGEESFTEEEEDEMIPSEEATSTEHIVPEEEVLDQENIRGEVEQEESNSNSEEDNENYQEHQNFQVEEPTEEIEPENEIDERMISDELMEHQNGFSSVPVPENDESQEHRASTPCEEELNSSPETPTENEDALAEIDRVLIENGVIPPKVIEATFENPGPSIKKNING